MYKRNKYHNKKTVAYGKLFDSKKEAMRYVQLRRMQDAGEIKELETQVPFLLVPAMKVNGKTWRDAKYIADFTYTTKDGAYVVEDAKGMRTDVYRLKKKLMYFLYKIEVKEV